MRRSVLGKEPRDQSAGSGVWSPTQEGAERKAPHPWGSEFVVRMGLDVPQALPEF